MLQPSVVRIGRVNQRLSVMDLSFPSHRQQLYHRTGSPPYFPPESKRQRQTEREGEPELWKAWEPIKRRKPSPLGYSVFHSNYSVFFKTHLPQIPHFFWHASLPCISSPCKIKKTFKCLLLKEKVHLSSALLPFTRQEKSFTLFKALFLGLLAKHGIVSFSASVLKGMDSDTLAMCDICSCLCGDRMAPNILFLLLQGMASASHLGRVRPADMGKGYARRHLRHNLYLTAQPLSPRKTENYTVAKLERERECLCVWLLESI